MARFGRQWPRTRAPFVVYGAIHDACRANTALLVPILHHEGARGGRWRPSKALGSEDPFRTLLGLSPSERWRCRLAN